MLHRSRLPCPYFSNKEASYPPWVMWKERRKEGRKEHANNDLPWPLHLPASFRHGESRGTPSLQPDFPRNQTRFSAARSIFLLLHLPFCTGYLIFLDAHVRCAVWIGKIAWIYGGLVGFVWIPRVVRSCTEDCAAFLPANPSIGRGAHLRTAGDGLQTARVRRR